MSVKFIFDEELERSKKELQSIIDFMDEDIETKRKADVLLTLTWGAVRSFVKPQIIEKEIKPEIKQRPVTLLNRLFGKRDIQPLVKKIPEKPKEQPKLEIMEAKIEKPKEPEIVEKNLILDKITDKILASVKITDKYYLSEPKIDDNDTKVLDKVLRKKPKTMDKGWKLITKYGQKFNIPPDHFTNIKYYVVNFLYGLGKVEALIYDKDISEIICEGFNKLMKVKYQDKIIETNIIYTKKEDLDNFILNIAYRANQKIKNKKPSASFIYREMNFDCTVGFEANSDSKFSIKKKTVIENQTQKNSHQ